MDEEKLESIKTLYSNLSELDDDPKLALLMRRYLHSLDGGSDENIQYIEWVSIMESVILTNQDDRNKKTRRFGKCLNYYMDDLSVDDAKIIYGIRSELVHAGVTNCDIIEQSKYSLRSIQEYCQHILKEYISGNIKAENDIID